MPSAITTKLRTATDSNLEPEERLLIKIFERARIDLFSASRRVQCEAEEFLAAHGYDIDEIRACWEQKRRN